MDRSAGATTRPDAPGIMLFRTSNHKSRNIVASAHICRERATHTLAQYRRDQGIAEETAGAAGRVVHRKLAKWASKQCGPPATPSPTLANPVQLPSWLRGAGSVG